VPKRTDDGPVVLSRYPGSCLDHKKESSPLLAIDATNRKFRESLLSESDRFSASGTPTRKVGIGVVPEY
jgi:hypothetical protein